MDPITIEMHPINDAPFMLPAPNEEYVVAPFVSTRDLGEHQYLVRVIITTHSGLSTTPRLTLNYVEEANVGQIVCSADYVTSDANINEIPNIFWYADAICSTPKVVSQAVVDAVDGGRPPVTSRGTIVTIQPTT
jgi:hypothetical protein